MATKKKMLQAAAGQAGGEALDITDVFSTYLYEGNGTSNRQITTNINTSDEGGMVWIKNRDGGDPHVLFDTERGSNKSLTSNTSDAEVTDYQRLTSFRDDGFRLGTDPEVNASNGDNYASWTFRKAPKFFDVITYTGTNATRTLNHNLGSVPGCIMFKNISEAGNWEVVFPNQGSNDFLYGYLNLTGALSDMSYAVAVQNNVVLASAPTSTSIELTPDDYTGFNKLGSEYVAYLFAHNDGDGEFGPDADQDIIKCGSYTGNGNYINGKYVDVGFEPQWILQKAASGTGPWLLLDTMRGWDVNTGNKPRLLANATNNEANADSGFALTGNSGFTIYDTSTKINGNGVDYIYMAIRRGPLAQPESGTEVFGMDDYAGGGDGPATGFVTDMAILGQRSGADKFYISSRLTGDKYMKSTSTSSELTQSNQKWDRMDGAWSSAVTGYMLWGLARAPGFFDVVCWYQPTDNAVTTINHNLGVAPEMIWTKSRTGNRAWPVFHKDITPMLELNTTTSATDTDPHQNVGSTSFQVNGSVTGEVGGPENYISYLFATLPGVSKVGSFSHTYGGTTNVDCGFTSGARFVLWKRTDGTRHWEVFDTTRGIVAGNDAYLRLSDTIAETSGDYIDPYSAGFSIGSALGTGEYIFYAIA